MNTSVIRGAILAEIVLRHSRVFRDSAKRGEVVADFGLQALRMLDLEGPEGSFQ